MLKIDYYTGVEPNSTNRMLVQGHFLQWYQKIASQVDARIISLPGGNGFREKATRKFFNLTPLPLLVTRRRNSLLHIPSVNVVNKAISMAATSPLVVTCFDTIIYEDNVEQLAIKRSGKILAAHKRVLEKADQVITISEHARSRIVEVFGIAPEKVAAIYLAVDHTRFFPKNIEKTPETLIKYGFSPDKRNILYVGSESPRKNLERIIRALPLVGKQVDIRFVKVGVPVEPYHSELCNLIRQLDLEDTVNFCGSVSMEDLPIMYNLADVFVFPSLYEGFGLPPLEAMACGCPVVTSNTTSLPEVVGDGAVIVDPYDNRSIADGILKVLKDEKYRQELIRAGRVQALEFDWQKTSDAILRVYNKVMA